MGVCRLLHNYCPEPWYIATVSGLSLNFVFLTFPQFNRNLPLWFIIWNLNFEMVTRKWLPAQTPCIKFYLELVSWLSFAKQYWSEGYGRKFIIKLQYEPKWSSRFILVLITGVKSTTHELKNNNFLWIYN